MCAWGYHLSGKGRDLERVFGNVGHGADLRGCRAMEKGWTADACP